MRVTHLSLSDFRNYRVAEVPFEPGLNLIIGRNGQGKTNLVEAIAYFASLASHRVAGDAALVRAGSESAVVRMKLAVGEREALLEVQLNQGKANRAQVNRNAVRPRELTRWFSAVVFAPEDLMLVRGEPTVRRRFLDEAVVARNPAFAGVLSDYERVVRQRSTLLKSARAGGRSTSFDATLEIWDGQLVELGTRIMLARRALVEAMAEPMRESYRSIVEHDHGPSISLSESVTATLERHGVSRETSFHSLSVERSPSTSLVERGSADSKPAAQSDFDSLRSLDHRNATDEYVDPSEQNVSSSAKINADASVAGGMKPTVTDDFNSLQSLDDRNSAVERSTAESNPDVQSDFDLRRSFNHQSSSVERGFAESNPSLSLDVSRETLESQFKEALRLLRRQELDRGMTLVGPHRDDALFELNSLPVKGYASHGESWSFALSLRLALAVLLREESRTGDPVIMLDDVFAELDVRRRNALMTEVSRFEQVIVTAAVEEDVPEALWHRVHISAGEVVDITSALPASGPAGDLDSVRSRGQRGVISPVERVEGESKPEGFDDFDPLQSLNHRNLPAPRSETESKPGPIAKEAPDAQE